MKPHCRMNACHSLGVRLVLVHPEIRDVDLTERDASYGAWISGR